jgi:hypothetical protein
MAWRLPYGLPPGVIGTITADLEQPFQTAITWNFNDFPGFIFDTSVKFPQ